MYFGSSQVEHTAKTLHECSNCRSDDMLNFDFLEKGLGEQSWTKYLEQSKEIQ